MARETWGQQFSNNETVLFQKGKWSLSEDGEKVWSLYFEDECVEPVLDYNKFKLFEKGFLLFRKDSNESSYALYYEKSRNPVFKTNNQFARAEIDDSYITFTDNETNTTFDINTLLKVYLDKDNQIGLNL